MASNMDWVAQALPAVHRDAAQAEAYLTTDPRAAAFYARRSVERIVEFLYATRGLDDPYSTDLAGRINAPAFSTLAGRGIVDKLNFLRKAGNNAVHKDLALDSRAALTILRELFHVLVWTAFHHGPHPEAVPTKAQFDPARAPRQADMPVEQLDAVIARLKAQDEANARLREESEQQAAAYEAEIAALREQIAAAQAAAAASELTDLHAYDYAEAETRTLYIDLLLHEAGWPLDQDRDREYPVTGLPTQGGTGRVDYVLWGADGLPLAVLEAKRTTRSPHEGQEQARRYADALEAQYGRRPLIFYSNGYEHWLWDDAAFGPAGGYPPVRSRGSSRQTNSSGSSSAAPLARTSPPCFPKPRSPGAPTSSRRSAPSARPSPPANATPCSSWPPEPARPAPPSPSSTSCCVPSGSSASSSSPTAPPW